MSTNRIARMKAPKGHCRGCGRPVPKGRFTWCSDVCVQTALIKLSPVVARRRVEERDRSICAQCGFDARRAEHVLGYLVERSYQRRSDAATYREALVWLLDVWAPRRTPRRRTDLWGWTVPHLWEADHIRPVVEGGGECELDNYRTLCIPCHRAETRELARRRAQRRKMPLFQEATA